MAVAFDAVGPAGGGGAQTAGAGPLTWAHINSAAGNAILVGVNYRSGTSPEATAVTYGGVSLARIGTVPGNNAGPGGIDLWGKIGSLPTGSNTVSVTFTGGAGNVTTGASISLTGAATFGTAFTAFASATSVSVNVTGTTTGGMIVAAASFGNSSGSFSTTAGTQRWSVIGDSNGAADNTAGGTWASPGGTQAVGFSETGAPADFWGLVAVEVKAAAVAAPGPGALLPLIPPGWFPGSAAVIQDPGGIPFYAEPAPTDATPAVIIPPTPEAVPVRPLPPGWFPGADRVTSGPGAIPFQPQPVPFTATPPVIFPVPEVAGIVDYLPLPPGYFPGSQTVTVDPGGIPFYAQPQPLNAPPPPPPVPAIAGLGGTGAGYFADQNGTPRFVLGDAVWGLPGNAGRWSSGDWRGDFNTYLATRAGQGFTVVYTKPMGTTQNLGINDDGRVFDGLFPFVGGSFANPSTGLTDAYWARFDYFLSAAAARGISVFCNAIGYDSDFETSGPLSGKSAGEFQSYGALIGARYANRQNLIWVVADDYFGSSDTQISSFLTGLRSAGANQPISIENFPESDSRQDITAGTPTAWGAANAQYNFCYSYNVTYFAVEKAYLEASPIPVITGDGYFYQGTSTYSTAPAYDRAIRQDAWHAISSGARGIIHGDEATWQWQATAQASAAANWYQKNNAGNIRALMESLPNWQLLVPDTSSQLVTAGRGTHATGFTSGGGGGQYEVAFTDSYVSASRVSDGTLAVIYLSHATTITIDQSKMAAGYAAWWVDPITGVKTSTGTGSTYNSATPGNNSQGDPDWVLVLQGTASTAAPPVAALPDWQPVPPGWFPGADRVTDLPGGIPFYVIPQPADQVAPPPSGVTTATAALAGAGAVAALVTEAPTAALSGAGTVAAVVTEAVTATAAGAGSVAAVVTEIAGASLAAAGSVTDVVTQAAAATLAGAGSVTDVVTQAVIASLTGAGALTANVAGAGSTASLAGAGAVTANATQAATATAAGAGAVTAAVTQLGSASLSGAGALTAAGQITGTASLAGAGAVSAKAAQAATASPAAAGALTALATQAATATAAGAGSVTAVSGTQAAFTVGQLSATAAAASTLTAGTQRTGGPS